MSVTTKSSAAPASAVHHHPLALTMSQREALQKFTVWRNSFDDRGDLFGGAAINAMLLQELVGQVERVADELTSIAEKPTPPYPSAADVQKLVTDTTAPIAGAVGKQQKEIDGLTAGAAQTTQALGLVQAGLGQAQQSLQSLGQRTTTLEQSATLGHDALEALKSGLSKTDHSVAAARHQLERIEEHLQRHERERDALRQRLDTLTGDVGRIVAEADWELFRSLVTLEERVRSLEAAEPHSGSPSGSQTGTRRPTRS